MIFGIDTCQEWILVIFELVAVILIACVGIVGAVCMFSYCLYKGWESWSVKYLWEVV